MTARMLRSDRPRKYCLKYPRGMVRVDVAKTEIRFMHHSLIQFVRVPTRIARGNDPLQRLSCFCTPAVSQSINYRLAANNSCVRVLGSSEICTTNRDSSHFGTNKRFLRCICTDLSLALQTII
jgi:hypothetical protein